ncbi:hypothetical protein VitviT2T_013708 [Vitis vinifera]|uniref:Enoyl reductase (ER) domain-containing protein n=1 Tax=Vitis vinifera TaxID=29760 RepID=A0ABY9CHG6_VITVI|nr:hypothetical protein VitviT2T_013708 [Vitis vinifera]
MKAVVITTSGDPQVLQVQEVENPEIGDDEVLIRVDAAAINRADTLQRKGLHPSSKAAVPTRVSNVLESSKLLEKPSFDGRLAIRLYIVTDLLAISFVMFCESWQYWNPLHYSRLVIRRESTDFNAILYVCALLSGGGYAEKVAVPAGQVLLVPSGVSLKDAAGIPEVACPVWSTVLMMSCLSAGETFQVHGGSIGIGTFAIQIAKYRGARVFVTAGLPSLFYLISWHQFLVFTCFRPFFTAENEEKLAVCKDL